MWRSLLLALLLGLGVSSAEAQRPAQRVALIIANAAYASARPLQNPPRDSQLIADALRRAGFQTIIPRADLTRAEFGRVLSEFRQQAQDAQVALIYYAGHGIEGSGKNWLIPVDARLATEFDLDFEAISLDQVLTAVEGAELRVVVLDACRDNPFARSWPAGRRAVTRGLAPVDVDDEVLVIYAAAPGQTASDGEGANSPFATSLAQRLPEPGLPIQLLAGRVRDDVRLLTNGVQRPFIAGSMTGEPFPLVAAAPGAVPIARTMSPELRAAALARAQPAVVRIITLSEDAIRRREAIAQLPADDPRRQLSTDFFLVRDGVTGFLVDARGYVATVAHSVDNAFALEVVLSDGRRLPATVAAVDDATNIAVLRLEGEGPFPTLAFDRLATIHVGDVVLVVGVGSEFLRGNVSALDATVAPGTSTISAYLSAMQLSGEFGATSNGAPVLNERGAAVGIAAVYSLGSGGSGVGQVLPASTISFVVEDLIAQGCVSRGWLGLTQQLHEGQVYVAAIVPDSPAEQAGLRQGDQLVSFAGQQITQTEDLTRSAAATRPGARVEVEYIRNDRRRSTTFEMGRRPCEVSLR